MNLIQEIKEALARFENSDDHDDRSRWLHAIELECVDWLQQAVEMLEQAQEEMVIIYTANEQQEREIVRLQAALSTISDLMADDTSERAQQINKLIASVEP